MLEFFEAIKVPICNYRRMSNAFPFSGLKPMMFLFIIVFITGVKILCYVRELANVISLLLNAAYTL